MSFLVNMDYIRSTAPVITCFMLLPKFTLSIIICFILGLCSAQTLTIYRSDRSVEETVDRLISLLDEEGLTYYETMIHDALPGRAIDETRVVLFEDPSIVTELLSCRQTVALELPFKILIWKEYGDVYIGFADPKLMTKKYILKGCESTLDDLTRLMIRLTSKVIRSS